MSDRILMKPYEFAKMSSDECVSPELHEAFMRAWGVLERLGKLGHSTQDTDQWWAEVRALTHEAHMMTRVEPYLWRDDGSDAGDGNI